MKRMNKTVTFGEARMIFWFKEVGSNLKTYGSDLGQEYITGPYKKHDPIQMITGPVMAAASVILEGPDQLIAGALDIKLEPSHGTLGRIYRDTRSLVKNIFTLHPARAVADAFRLPGSAFLDIGDAAGAHRQTPSYSQSV